MREQGYYWVRLYEDPTNPNSWSVGEWHFDHWMAILGWVEGYYLDKDLQEVGPRIYPPISVNSDNLSDNQDSAGNVTLQVTENNKPA